MNSRVCSGVRPVTLNVHHCVVGVASGEGTSGAIGVAGMLGIDTDVGAMDVATGTVGTCIGVTIGTSGGALSTAGSVTGGASMSATLALGGRHII